MNTEDQLNLLWAKKTARQLLGQSQASQLAFTCPTCGGTAKAFVRNDANYLYNCASGCFSAPAFDKEDIF